MPAKDTPVPSSVPIPVSATADTASEQTFNSPDAMAHAARGMTTAAVIGQITQQGFAEMAVLQAETANAVHTEIFGLVAQAFAANDPFDRMALPQRCADAAMRLWMAHSERSGRLGQDILSRAVAASTASSTNI